MTCSAPRIRQWERDDRVRERAAAPRHPLDAAMAPFDMEGDRMRPGARLERPSAPADEVERILRERIKDHRRGKSPS